MLAELNTNVLELDAIYLGILTARGSKPLSRLEYPVTSSIRNLIKGMGLIVQPIRRFAQNGTPVNHWVIGRNLSLINQYRSDFDGKLLGESMVEVVRLEAWYFGYPVCCAEAYIKSPYTQNNLSPKDQQLFFHYACPGCEETPVLIPIYRLALAEAELKYKKLQSEKSS